MKKAILFAAVAAIFCSCGTQKLATTSTQTYEKSSQVNQTVAPFQNNTSKDLPEQQVKVSAAAQKAFESQQPVNAEMLEFGFARSGDKAKAGRDALKSAQNNIAIRLYRTISAVDKEFAEDITIGDKISTRTTRADMIVGVIDRKTASISYTTAPSYERVDGIYECSVEVKLTPEILQSITKEIYNSIPAKDDLKLRYDEQKFYEETYQKTLEEFRKSSSENK